MGQALLYFLQTFLPLQVKKPREAKTNLNSSSGGLAFTARHTLPGPCPHCALTSRLQTSWTAPSRQLLPRAELVGMGHHGRHLLGAVLDAFPSVWENAAAANSEISSSGSPWHCSVWHQGQWGAVGKLTAGFVPLLAQGYWGGQ